MWARVKQTVRAAAPGLIRYWTRRNVAAARLRNRDRSPREIFTEIYSKNRWGGAAGAVSSGSGSTLEHAERYAEAVKRFMRERGLRRMVDLGCGDFTVGALLVGSDVDYVGVDIVEGLVSRHQREHSCDGVAFLCLDIVSDALPDGDLCLLRQVLQHLSNSQIGQVLSKLAKYRYVLVSEHYPAPGAEGPANLDKPCGEDVRVYDGSAVYLDRPPFDAKVTQTLLDVDAGRWLVRPGERIRTVVIENSVSEAGPRPGLAACP